MKRHYIDSMWHPLYGAFETLYRGSFPVFERRTEEQQTAAFANERYRLPAFTDGEEFVGFISCWEFETYCYVEHFAINAELRGRGYGSDVLGEFTRMEGKRVVLEIDPVTDSVSAARLRFYKRCGFCENVYVHRHPAYRGDYEPHELVVMTTDGEMSQAEYERFCRDLSETVMNVDEKGCRRNVASVTEVM